MKQKDWSHIDYTNDGHVYMGIIPWALFHHKLFTTK